MDKTYFGIIGLGTMFPLLLLSCFCMSEEVIYRPHELFSISCGSSTNSTTIDGRNWTADLNFVSKSHGSSVAAPPLTPSTEQRAPYTFARLSYSQFTYSFPVTSGQKFLRLFFYSTSYQYFDHSIPYFSVKAGPYTLFHYFNASDYPENFFKEYCINIKDGEKLDITFIPNITAQHQDSYAFINGIEIVSMPSYLYHTNPYDNNRFPQFVGHMTQTYTIENTSALEKMYRLTVAGTQISSSEDTGMLRLWDGDEEYIASSSGPSVNYEKKVELSFITIPNYTAPDQVYRSLRNMGPNTIENMRFNLTWKFPVYSGFYYLLRLHFCQLSPDVNFPGDQIFSIFIQDQLAEEEADILRWSNSQKGVPVVKDYAVSYIPGNYGEKVDLLLKMHPHPRSWMKDAQLNAIELFKLNDTNGRLAESNANLPFGTPQNQISKMKRRGTTRTVVAIAGAVSGVVLLSIIIVAYHRNNVTHDNQKDGTSGGSGSSSLPTNLCRHFTIKEIKDATNNFDELLVVGVGGFGNVYKGYVDGSTPVAIKRLKPGSQQGLKEFMNEIEMLSQLRHLHLVSLIGYCYESNEMILVYDFMDRGTLRDHLDINPSLLSWKQRLQICIGAGRGLHYLHTGVKHMIIHRDVKSTNILLDEKWVAKVSDFGLSRVGPTGSSTTHVSTEVKGSVGYLDPEYYKRRRLTEKSDVYSYGVVLLEVLSGRQPLLRSAEKQQVSLGDWAKHLHKKGSLGEIVDPTMKGQISSQCLHRFVEVALSCLLEDGTHRPSMNDIVGMLDFVLHLHDTVARDNENREDVFSSGYSSVQLSDFSNSSGLNSTINNNDSYGSKKSDRLIPDNVFSQIEDPKGR